MKKISKKSWSEIFWEIFENFRKISKLYKDNFRISLYNFEISRKFSKIFKIFPKNLTPTFFLKFFHLEKNVSKNVRTFFKHPPNSIRIFQWNPYRIWRMFLKSPENFRHIFFEMKKFSKKKLPENFPNTYLDRKLPKLS